MRIYTAHLAPGRAPLLVREGFSLGAFLFGPLWLFAHRAWVAGAIALAVLVGIGVLAVLTAGSTLPLITLLGYAAMLGWNGRDLCRWSLARQGYRGKPCPRGSGRRVRLCPAHRPRSHPRRRGPPMKMAS